ncbi:MAG: hypothetical protein P8Y25_07775, partial [Chromatiaceae bacterium]
PGRPRDLARLPGSRVEKLTAVTHLTIPRDQVRQVMGPAIAEMMTTLDAQGGAAIGLDFSCHPNRPPKLFDWARVLRTPGHRQLLSEDFDQ